jgi:hypothetical protein
MVFSQCLAPKPSLFWAGSVLPRLQLLRKVVCACSSHRTFLPPSHEARRLWRAPPCFRCFAGTIIAAAASESVVSGLGTVQGTWHILTCICKGSS